MNDEVERQGLTKTAARDAVKGAADKAKAVGSAGRDAIIKQFAG